MNRKNIVIGLITMCLPTWAMAETVALRCMYMQTTYDAPFMSQPEKRDCPESLCYYDVTFDSAGGTASVNGVAGHQLEITADDYVLTRSVSNRIVEGMDTAFFTINRQSLKFKSKKTTPPSVSVSAAGSCVAAQ